MSAHLVTEVLACRCEQLFDLAADIERYPDYLPGWQSARIVERVGNRLRVEQQLGLPLFGHSFVSTALLEGPDRVTIQSNDGPFSKLHIEWHFEQLAQGRCRVTLRLEYQLTSLALKVLADQLFQVVAADVIERFKARAQTLYGCRAIME